MKEEARVRMGEGRIVRRVRRKSRVVKWKFYWNIVGFREGMKVRG